MRQARDGAEFLARLGAEPGIRARVVTGEEEAGLTLLGATWGLGPTAGTVALLDIGGGSTEVLLAEGCRVLVAVSLTLGVVQLVERFFGSDPAEPAELARCRDHVDRRLRDEVWPRLRPHRPTTLIASAGTPTTLAALDLGLSAYDPARVQGHRLGAGAIERLTAAARRAAARRACPDAGARTRPRRRDRPGWHRAGGGARRPRSLRGGGLGRRTARGCSPRCRRVAATHRATRGVERSDPSRIGRVRRSVYAVLSRSHLPHGPRRIGRSSRLTGTTASPYHSMAYG